MGIKIISEVITVCDAHLETLRTYLWTRSRILPSAAYWRSSSLRGWFSLQNRSTQPFSRLPWSSPSLWESARRGCPSCTNLWRPSSKYRGTWPLHLPSMQPPWLDVHRPGSRMPSLPLWPCASPKNLVCISSGGIVKERRFHKLVMPFWVYSIDISRRVLRFFTLVAPLTCRCWSGLRLYPVVTPGFPPNQCPFVLCLTSEII